MTASGYYPATDISWKELSATFTGTPRQPKGAEPATANDLVKAYPVRTELSRYLTEDSDCVVVIIPSLEKDKGQIRQQVRDAVIDAVAKLKPPHKKRICFVLKNFIADDERKQLCTEFYKLAEDMKFDTSAVMLR